MSQSRGIYYSPNDISDMINQIYILNFMLFKQKYTNIFLIEGAFIFQRVTFFVVATGVICYVHYYYIPHFLSVSYASKFFSLLNLIPEKNKFWIIILCFVIFLISVIFLCIFFVLHNMLRS